MTMSGRKSKPFIPGAMWAAQDQPEQPRLSLWARVCGWFREWCR